MSTTADAPPTTDCPRCGAPLRPDQDWCLNCGTAVTTEIAGAPGWRTPVAIVAVVLLLAAGALVFAFLQISDDADRTAQAPAPTPAPAAPAAPTATPTAEPTATASPVPTPPASAPGATPTPAVSPVPGTSPTPGAAGTAGTWPAGRDAWTVVLFSSTRKAEADSKAKAFADQGKPVGVLDSDDYSSLRGGYFVVFSGQYDSQDQAQTAAEGFGSSAPGAYARKVTPK
jgi:hypothetical protein